MGELPPLLTPQGPGVTWARRPRFPRVDDSGTSCSSFVIFRLVIDLPFTRRIRFWYFVSAFPFTSRYWLLHGSPRPCCPVFPLVSFPFLASGYPHVGSTAASSSTDDSTFPRSPFGSRFYLSDFADQLLWPAVGPKASHTTPPERQSQQGKRRQLNLSLYQRSTVEIRVAKR